MNHIHYQYVKSPCGELILASYDEKLCMCDWRYRSMRDRIDRRIKHGLNARFLEKNNQLIEHAIDQLDAYFNAKRKVFDIPLLVVGSNGQLIGYAGGLDVKKKLLDLEY